jgi:acyl transferase domain-containing protein/aryl carrier-like protein
MTFPRSEQGLSPSANELAPPAREPLAIVGIGCRFPGGADAPEAFWKLLWEGKDATTEVPPGRWRAKALFDPDARRAGKLASPRGGFLATVDRFDPLVFGISPREAVAIDPQQRLLLELAWEALEDAGIVAERLAGSRTAVFIGLSAFDYGSIQHQTAESRPVNPYLMLGTTLSIAANRISYTFDLRGPSLVVDTACSSSLTALHLAGRSIWQGESDLALVGGANLLLQPTISVYFANAGMLSPDGRCKSFDAGANGYVRGEGGGVVVLKPLARALRDNDRIYALILGSAVNQDGHTPGISVPSGEAQQALLYEAYRDAKVAPADVQFVEAHGTGTPVGDPIEANALGAVLAEGRPSGAVCWVGSVKTNIGHLEAGAGIAGVIKTALALYHRKIPPSLHFKTPNPRIDFDRLRLAVPVEPMDWPANGVRPRLAGVNSFGFGGANAHAVLASLEDDKVTGWQGDKVTEALSPCHLATLSPCHLLPLSAHSPEALMALAAAWREWLAARPDTPLADLVYTAGVRRGHHLHRLALVADSTRQVAERLEACRPGDLELFRRGGGAVGRIHPNPRVVFVFTGMGAQWWGMGRQLLEQEPVFREAVGECDHLLRRHVDWSLLKELAAEPDRSRIDEPRIAQPAVFALQVALAALWNSWGVHPAAVVGHSVGEVAAAQVAGALSLADAVAIIHHRSRLQQQTRGHGKMLAASLSEREALRLIGQTEARSGAGPVAVAAVNSPGSVTLSGDTGALEAIARALEARGTFQRFLRVDVPYHSPLMDPLRDDLLLSLRGVQPRPPAVALISTVTGQRVGGPDLDASYWWQNIRRPVCFARALAALLEADHETFLEVGPHPVLAAAIRECAEASHRPATVLASLRRGEQERPGLLQTLGQLYTRGLKADWERVNPAGRLVALPGYPWQRERFWRESDESRQVREGRVWTLCPGLLGKEEHRLLGRPIHSATPAGDRTWHVDLDLEVEHSWLADHRIQGATLYPAAGYIETAMAVFRKSEHDPVSLEAVEFSRPLILPAGRTQALELVVDGLGGFTFFGKELDGSWARVASGKEARARKEPPTVMLDEVRRRCPHEITGQEWYRELQLSGSQYGPCFRGVRTVWCGDGEVLALVGVPELLASSQDDYGFHPVLIDACIQCCHGTVSFSGEKRLGAGAYVPRRAGHVNGYRPQAAGRAPPPMYCHVRRAPGGENGLCDLRLVDAQGQVLLEILAMQSVRVGDPPADQVNPADCLYEYRWQLEPRRGRFAEGMPPVARLLQEVGPEVARLRADHLGRVREARPRLDALCAAYARHALWELGWRAEPGMRASASELAGELGIAPQQYRLFASLLEVLAEEGDLRRVGDCWEVERSWNPEHRPDVAWQGLLRRFPSYLAELTLLGRCGVNLARVLRGQVDAAGLLHTKSTPKSLISPATHQRPEVGSGMLEHFEHSAPSVRCVNAMAQAVAAALLRLLPPERQLRVLQLGTGSLAALLPLLPRHQTAYVLTDKSSPALEQARQRFQAFPFVQYRQLDLDEELPPREFDLNGFDIVLTSHLVGAPFDPGRALPRVRELLAPDGLLLWVVRSRRDRLGNLVFAAPRDDSSAPPGSWLECRDFLTRAGFAESLWLGDGGEEDPLNALILARAFRPKAPDREPAPAPLTVSLAYSPLVSDPVRPAPGCWVLFADGSSVASVLGEHFGRRGDRTVQVRPGIAYQRLKPDLLQVRPGQPEDMVRLLGELAGGPERLRGVVHLWSLDAGPAGRADWPDDAHRLGCLSVLPLVQACAAAGSGDRPRIYLVTRGAQSVRRGEEPAANQATLWGLGRAIRSEHPELRCTLIDLGEHDSALEARELFDELVAEDIEDELALRDSDRYVHRLRKVDAGELFNPDRADEHEGAPFRLEAVTPGLIDSLGPQAIARRPPGPGEVEIEVHAAALNFKDVAKALNLLGDVSLRDTWSGRLLGLECAGVVVGRGDKVEGVQVGDAVIAQTPGCLASHVTVDARLTARKPADLTFEEAAAIPVAFGTAAYALEDLARIERGERVLIHAASGGVGLAAVQLARLAGAEVFATAGSPEKRDFLRLLGVEHVMDSRSVDFAREVLERTGGRGVDIVLNSLAGVTLTSSLAVLAPGGRFLELGKRDIEQNARLPLEPFQKHLAFFAIDLDRLWASRPGAVHSSLARVMQRLNEGDIHPLPYRAFPVAQARDAFRCLARARHIGKVVLTAAPAPPSPGTSGRASAALFRGDASYLITGGLGGFGLAAARWMVEGGARCLVLVSRRGAVTAEAREGVRQLEEAGARVVVARADVCREEQVGGLLDQVRQTMPPLRGVFHAAMVQDEGLLGLLDRERFHAVMAPKVAGAMHLHRLTAGDPLDYFVLFSSTVSLFGGVGLSSYAAANAHLDCLAHYRRALGLPGLSVNWTAVSDVGYVAGRPEIRTSFEQRGFVPLPSRVLLDALGILLRRGAVQTAVLKLDWSQTRTNTLTALSPTYAGLPSHGDHGVSKTASVAGGGLSLRERLQTLDAPARRALLIACLREQVAQVLGLPPASLDPDLPLTGMGLESLMAVDLSTRVRTELGFEVTMLKLLGGVTLNQLMDDLQDQASRQTTFIITSQSQYPPRSQNSSMVDSISR